MSMSLADFNRIRGGDRFLRECMERAKIADSGVYVDFVRRLYRDLDQIIFDMQRDRHLRQKDSEDRLTIDLLYSLRRLGYDAEHDPQKGGHIDLDVQYGPHTWIGESKKDGSYDEGFKQLKDRYVPSSGNFAHNHAGLIFFLVKTKDAVLRMRRWADALAKLGATRAVECGGNPLAMYSEHKLQGPGTMMTIRSMFVSLYHKPTDKSALKAAAGKRAKSRKT